MPNHLKLFAVLLLVQCQLETSEQMNTTENEPTFQQTMETRTAERTAPVAAQEAKTLSIHGDDRVDNYYWMKLTDAQKNAEQPDAHTQRVLDYLNAENDYREDVMAPLKPLQEKLYEEIVGRIKQTDMSVPFRDNGYFYFSRYEEGKEYPIYGRKNGSLDAAEEIMLDVNELAKDYAYYQVGGTSVSPNNRLLAYGVDTLSRRIYTLKFKDLETGEMLTDEIPNTGGSAVWANDNRTVFYPVKDETLRTFKIFKHRLGTPTSEDEEVYHEADETFGTFVYKSKSKEYIIIGSYQTLSSEYRVLDADDPDGEFRIIQPRERKLEYDIAHYGEHFYIRTNLDAKNFRLMRTPVNATGKENWTEVVPHRDDVLLEGMDIFKDYLVLSERQGGITRLRVMPWEGEEHYIEMPEAAYLAYTSANREFDTDILRYGYTSLTTPNSVYDYNMQTRERELLKEQEVIGDFDKNNYTSERILVPARDGTEVPVSIVYRKGTPKDGTAPLLLYGYGSYGASMDPYFSSVRLSLLDRGFIYAIAHIRGGQELGRAWYEDGKLLNKKNTFTDFIDVGEWMVANNYTSKDNLFGMGGSAGGLLMGAVVNMRPDLWRGVIAAVPFVDVITTMLDETIPLTTGEYDEWGNPNDAKYYEYIKSYSPYDQVRAQNYPPMLVTTGLHDSQVQYWEPAKWVAKLRELKTDQHPLLLYTNMDTGHGGASGRFERYRETAMEYAFLLDLARRAQP